MFKVHHPFDLGYIVSALREYLETLSLVANVRSASSSDRADKEQPLGRTSGWGKHGTRSSLGEGNVHDKASRRNKGPGVTTISLCWLNSRRPSETSRRRPAGGEAALASELPKDVFVVAILVLECTRRCRRRRRRRRRRRCLCRWMEEEQDETRRVRN